MTSWEVNEGCWTSGRAPAAPMWPPSCALGLISCPLLHLYHSFALLEIRLWPMWRLQVPTFLDLAPSPLHKHICPVLPLPLPRSPEPSGLRPLAPRPPSLCASLADPGVFPKAPYLSLDFQVSQASSCFASEGPSPPSESFTLIPQGDHPAAGCR